MAIKEKLYILISLFVLGSCQRLPYLFDNDRVVASVGDRVLYASEVTSRLPIGISSGDSLSFVEVYTQKWIASQVKVREAERIFSSSAGDIAEQVAAYRLSLLNRKLDKYYINSSTDIPYTKDDVVDYYTSHHGEFRLERPIVKGRVIRLPIDYPERSKSKLLDVMKDKGEMRRTDLLSLSQKNGYKLTESLDSWIDYGEFLDCLPVSREQDHTFDLTRRGVRQLTDSLYLYCFEVVDNRKIGDIAPLEMVEGVIGQILSNRYQIKLIQSYEQGLMHQATQAGIIKNYLHEEE
ncbi:MAG: hypothetical protein SNF60_01910 [Rikenellaceae bacterium]